MLSSRRRQRNIVATFDFTQWELDFLRRDLPNMLEALKVGKRYGLIDPRTIKNLKKLIRKLGKEVPDAPVSDL